MGRLRFSVPDGTSKRKRKRWRRSSCPSPNLGLYCFMRVIALSTLRRFWTGKAAYADAREPTLAWYRHVLQADWSSPAGVKRDFGNASILRDGRVESDRLQRGAAA